MTNIFIYGGCVSRDTFEHLKDSHALVQYVSRQSLISAASLPTRKLRTGHLSSNFQDRAVIGDVNSSLFLLIAAKQANTDVLVFDILSERLGVFRIPGGTYVTKSTELTRTKIINELEKPATTIAFGTDRHFNLWKESAAKFVSVLKRSNLFERSLLIEAPWTEASTSGIDVPRYRGWTAEYANETYARYYSHLRELGFNSICIPPDLAISTDEHKWGPAPYHYTESTYHWLKLEILAFGQGHDGD